MFTPTMIVYIVAVLAIFAFLQGMAMVLAGAFAEGRTLRRRTMADGVSPWLAEILLTRRMADFEALVRGSGLRHSATRVATFMALLVLAVMLGLDFWGYDALRSLVGGLIVGGVVPLLVLLRLRSRRMAKLTIQLPDAIDMLVRALRAGLPVPVGIRMIATEMSDPVGREFREVFDAMSYGLDLREALEQLAYRLQVPEVKYLVAAIRIQYASGGNLSEVLDTLSSVMRARVRFKLKVRALSAESRVSGNIMALVPFVLSGGMIYLRPDFYKEVPHSPFLQMVLGIAACLLVIGIILMRRIVNIRA